MACCSWRFVNIEAVVSDVYFNQSDINLNMTAAINRPVFLFSDQAGYILDIHKASVLPYKVFLYLNAANVFADIIVIKEIPASRRTSAFVLTLLYDINEPHILTDNAIMGIDGRKR